MQLFAVFDSVLIHIIGHFNGCLACASMYKPNLPINITGSSLVISHNQVHKIVSTENPVPACTIVCRTLRETTTFLSHSKCLWMRNKVVDQVADDGFAAW